MLLLPVAVMLPRVAPTLHALLWLKMDCCQALCGRPRLTSAYHQQHPALASPGIQAVPQKCMAGQVTNALHFTDPVLLPRASVGLHTLGGAQV